MTVRHPSLDLPVLDLTSAWSLVGERVETIETLAHGPRSRVYRVTLEDRSTRIVRIAPRDPERAAREAWVRRQVSASVSTVAPVRVPSGSLGDQVDVTLMRDVPGATLASQLPSLRDHEARGLWQRFGHDLSVFHEVATVGFGLIDGAGHARYERWHDAARALASSALEQCRSTPLVDVCAEAEEALARCAPALEEVHRASLTHGDAHLGNVQVANREIVAWFDFEYALGADPVYELCFVEGVLALEGASSSAFEHVAEGYRTRAGTWPYDPDSDRVRFYRLVHALRASEYLSFVAPSLARHELERVVVTHRARVQRNIARALSPRRGR